MRYSSFGACVRENNVLRWRACHILPEDTLKTLGSLFLSAAVAVGYKLCATNLDEV